MTYNQKRVKETSKIHEKKGMYLFNCSYSLSVVYRELKYKLLELPELTDRCASCSIAVRRVNNFHEERPYFLADHYFSVNIRKFGDKLKTVFLSHKPSREQKLLPNSN